MAEMASQPSSAKTRLVSVRALAVGLGLIMADQATGVALQLAVERWGGQWLSAAAQLQDWLQPYLIGAVFMLTGMYLWGRREAVYSKVAYAWRALIRPWKTKPHYYPMPPDPTVIARAAQGDPRTTGDKDAHYAGLYGIDATNDRREREIFGAAAAKTQVPISADPLNKIAPIPLNNDEAQLLSELRKFIVLLSICDERLTAVTDALLALDWKRRASDPTTRVLHRYFNNHVWGQHPKMLEIKKLAETAASRTDLVTISLRIAQYLEHNYAVRQRAVGSLGVATKENVADYPQTKEWLEAESRCLEQWEAIKMSPTHTHLASFDPKLFGRRGNLYLMDED